MIKELEKIEDFYESIKSETLTVVDFWASWCGPCKALAPIIEKIDKQLGDQIVFLKFNIDTCEAPKEINLRSVPTLVFYKAGELKTKRAGMITQDELVRLIETHF